MATEPVASQRQGSGDLLDERRNEPWTEGELDATGGHNPPLPGKAPPRAEPEEDFLQPDPKEQPQSLEAHKEPERSGEDTSQPQPQHTSPTEKGVETKVVSSSEGEVISVSTQDLTSSDGQNSEEKPLTVHLTDPTDRGEELNTEKMKDHNAKTGEAAIGLESTANDLDNNESEQDLSGAAAETTPSMTHPPSDRDTSDDMFTTGSPPFADEGDEEEEGSMDSNSMDISSIRRQWVQLDSSSRPPQSSYSRSSPTSGQPEPVPSGKQQGEQLLQSQPEHAPGEEKQEAAQQVFSQGSPPLVSVATEPANQAEAGSQGSGCAVVVREKGTGAGERREAESRQTGGEREQKVSGLNTGKAVAQQHTRGGLEYSRVVKQHEQKIEKHSTESASKDSRALMMESDDSQSDSGVSADFSPCSTVEIPAATTTPPGNETPIEREIRRAVEREYSLRRSRGLQNPPTTPEYVDVPLRKCVLTQNLPANCEKGQGKDRQLAGKKMQQEIYTETQREQVLVQLGKVPGIYDKGTVRQLKERKLLFEAFQEAKDSSSTLSPRSKTPSWASASNFSTLENQGDDSSTASTLGGSYMERRRSVDPLSQTQSQSPTSASYTYSAPRGPGLSEGTSCQVIILENNRSLPAATLFPPEPVTPSYSSASLTKAEALTVVDSGALYASSARTEDRGNARREENDEQEEEELAPKDNPFFKLRSSTTLDKVEQDIREARERERALRKQRNSLYGGCTGAGGEGGEVGGRHASRETESPSAPPPLNGLTLDLPATPSRAHRQSLGKLGIWPPAQSEDQQVIQPESPRTPRQRTPLLQRWEAGLVNGHGEEAND